nr:retrovirus-related Pol polyprotein from transposon TNT 1-94 [Tanacetum cinerariifolium]
MYLHIHDFPEILMNLHDMLYLSYPCFTCSAVFVITYIPGSSGLRRFFRYGMFTYSFYLCYVLSLYPFTERYAQPYFFSCLIRQTLVSPSVHTLCVFLIRGVDVFFRLSRLFQTFKTLCLLNYALMIRHDYDLTSSLRRGVLHFGCLVTILNTLDLLGKFDGKADEGFLVGYSVNSKAFRVFNNRTRIVQETLHINFLENKPNVAGIGPTWLFDIDTLTKSMNYQPVVAGNQPNDNAGIKENLDAGKVRKEIVSAQQYVLLSLWSTGSQDPQNIDADDAFDVKENKNDVHVSANGSDKSDSKKHDEKAKKDAKGKSHVGSPIGVRNLRAEFEDFSFNITNRVNAVSTPVNAAGLNPTNITNSFNTACPSDTVVSPNFGIARKSIVYSDDEEDVGAEADLSNLETNIPVSPIPTTRVHKDHPVNQIIGDLIVSRFPFHMRDVV